MLYISHLLDTSSSHNTIASAVCAIKWIHEIYGKPDPIVNTYIQTLFESSKQVYRSNFKSNLIYKNKPLSNTVARESVIKG